MRSLGLVVGSLALLAGAAPASARTPAHGAPGLGGAGGPGDQVSVAPDGKRGFGSGRELADILRVFRQPSDDEREWLAALLELPAAIETFSILARDRYEQRGYFALVDARDGRGAEHDLAALHAAFRASEADGIATLRKRDGGARAFARMYFDLRFLLRAAALDGYPSERRELAAALGVLRAATDGHVQLDEGEARAIASRADLAASLLRAIRADLESLHPAKAEQDVESDTFAKADALVALAAARDRDRDQAFELAARVDELARSKRRMTESLGVERLRARLAEALGGRAKAQAECAKLRDRARLFVDDPDDQAPTEVAKLSRSERLRVARELAARALAKDPLDEDATWFLAETVDFFDGERFSRQHFDRFLALRGIRSHLWESFRDRQLDAREQRALDVVQRADRGPLR